MALILENELLCLIHKCKKIHGRTKVQKIAYLISRKKNLMKDANFVLYHYGPFSNDVASALIDLERAGDIEVETQLMGFRQDEEITAYTYAITQKGIEKANTALSLLNQTQIKDLGEAATMNELTLKDLREMAYKTWFSE